MNKMIDKALQLSNHNSRGAYMRFKRQGIPHPTEEAKKYLL